MADFSSAFQSALAKYTGMCGCKAKELGIELPEGAASASASDVWDLALQEAHAMDTASDPQNYGQFMQSMQPMQSHSPVMLDGDSTMQTPQYPILTQEAHTAFNLNSVFDSPVVAAPIEATPQTHNNLYKNFQATDRTDTATEGMENPAYMMAISSHGTASTNTQPQAIPRLMNVFAV